MNNGLLIWLLPIAIALHNVEEAIWLPGWSQEGAGRGYQSVGPQSFRFAVSILTLIAFLLAVWTHIRGYGSLGHYLLLAYALGQSVNVFVPHVFATIATRTYMPGLLSGILFVLPAANVLLFHAFVVEHLEIGRFFIVAGIFIPLMLLSIPILFRIGGTVNLEQDK